MLQETTAIKKAILRELLKKRIIGGAHTPLDNIFHHLPDEYLHDKKGQKIVAEAVKELANAELVTILKKKTGKGTGHHISLNPRKLKETGDLLELQREEPTH